MGREGQAWKDVMKAMAPTTKIRQAPRVGLSLTSLTQLLGVQVWQQRPTKGRYFPRNGVIASSFVPKPEDHWLVWKVAGERDRKIQGPWQREGVSKSEVLRRGGGRTEDILGLEGAILPPGHSGCSPAEFGV